MIFSKVFVKKNKGPGELTDAEVRLKNAHLCDSVSISVKCILYCLNAKILLRCRYLEISILRIHVN